MSKKRLIAEEENNMLCREISSNDRYALCLNQRWRKVAGDNSVWLGRVYAAIAINKGTVRIATRESATICTITLYWFTKYSERGRHTRTVITRSLSNFQLIRRVSDYKNSNLIVAFCSTPRFLYEVYDNEGMLLNPFCCSFSM